MKICIVNFSARKQGNCHHIARLARSYYEPAHTVCLFELGNLRLTPCGRCDYACFQKDTSCPFRDDDIWRLYEALSAADAAVFVIPNYCGYPCANFFMFNERCQGFFHTYPALGKQYIRMPKKAIVVSNTEDTQIREVLRGLVEKDAVPEVLTFRSVAFGKRSVAGDLMDSPEAQRLLFAYLSR